MVCRRCDAAAVAVAYTTAPSAIYRAIERSMSVKTEAAYKAGQRARKRDAGLVVLEVWCRPADKERVRRYVARLIKGVRHAAVPQPDA